MLRWQNYREVSLLPSSCAEKQASVEVMEVFAKVSSAEAWKKANCKIMSPWDILTYWQPVPVPSQSEAIVINWLAEVREYLPEPHYHSSFLSSQSHLLKSQLRAACHEECRYVIPFPHCNSLSHSWKPSACCPQFSKWDFCLTEVNAIPMF